MKKTFQWLLIFLLVGCNAATEKPISYSDQPVTKPMQFLPGIISTDQNDEFDVTFTPDGKQIYFTRRGRKEGDIQKIYQTSFDKGEWSVPEVASFSTSRDETPFLTPDGQTLYFGSERPIPGKPNLGGFDMNVWVVQKDEETWSDPTPLPEPINYVQQKDENWPSSNNNFFSTPDGQRFYFTTMYRGEKAISLYSTDLEDQSFSTPKKIEGFFETDSLWVYSASVSPDQEYLVFNSYGAPGGLGGEDLYISKRTSSGWSKARNLGSLINSEGEESSGRFSPDGKYFFFTHADNLGNWEYGPWSIYFLETKYLKLEELF